jgi:hypothetical protein
VPDDEMMYRIDAAADAVAAQFGGVATVAQNPRDGAWVATIELTGAREGEFVCRAEGATRAQALSNLIREAREFGAT